MAEMTGCVCVFEPREPHPVDWLVEVGVQVTEKFELAEPHVSAYGFARPEIVTEFPVAPNPETFSRVRPNVSVALNVADIEPGDVRSCIKI